MKTLSICITTFNRKKLLCKLISTIPQLNELQIIIVDDGSTDNTQKIIEQKLKKNNIEFIYFYQSNSGRAVALRKAISLADGEYTIIMDSDDYFLKNGIVEILESISILKGKKNGINSLVFGAKLIKINHEIKNIPPSGVTNLISLRADLNVKGDLKEVVRTDILKSCLYSNIENIRRVPTSLLWAKAAEITDCFCVSKIVAVKEYLPNGMTARNLQLRSENPQPLLELYELLSMSKKYSSMLFRVRSKLLWGRYANHIRTTSSLNYTFKWQYLYIIISFPIYLLDLIKLNTIKDDL